MKKLLCFALATLMLLTALVGCNVKPVTPPDDNPTEQPGTTDPGTTDPGSTDPGTTDPGTTDPGTTDPGTDVTPLPPVLNDGEAEKTTEHTVGNGKFVFSEQKFDYKDQNLVLMDVKNETDANYTLKINYVFYDAEGQELLTASKTFEGFASGMQRPILLWHAIAFDSYSYTIETTPYDGVCLGENLTMEYKGLIEAISHHGGDVMYPTLWGTVEENNQNTTPHWRCATVILFDNTGNIYGIYTMGMEFNDSPCKLIHRNVMNVYQHLEEKMVWPENLTGDLRCVVVPYYHETMVELHWNSDMPIFFPDITPFDPTAQ